MTKIPTCPFCGVSITADGRHPVNDCHMANCTRLGHEWTMRSEKEEQPADESTSDLLTFHLAAEIQWLRSIVEKLVIEEQPMNYSVTYDGVPSNFGGETNKVESGK